MFGLSSKNLSLKEPISIMEVIDYLNYELKIKDEKIYLCAKDSDNKILMFRITDKYLSSDSKKQELGILVDNRIAFFDNENNKKLIFDNANETTEIYVNNPGQQNLMYSIKNNDENNMSIKK